MNSQLIVHQPYRTLTSLQSEFSLSQDETALAWSVINDHYMTDLPLLCPPHIIALTAVLLALVLRPSNGPNQGNQNSSITGGGNAAAMGIAAATAALAQAQAGAALAGGHQGQQPSTPGGLQGSANGKEKVQDIRVSKVQRFAAWLAESNIDIEAMVDCTQELIAFYECHEQYNDKLTREQIIRFVKARGLDK